jgi:hypothetical protein
MSRNFHYYCSSRRKKNPNSKNEQRGAKERKIVQPQARKRHGAAALQDAVAMDYALLLPQGPGVRQPYAAFTSVRWQASFFDAAMTGGRMEPPPRRGPRGEAYIGCYRRTSGEGGS